MPGTSRRRAGMSSRMTELASCGARRRYVLVGEPDDGICGHPWLTWGVPAACPDSGLTSSSSSGAEGSGAPALRPLCAAARAACGRRAVARASAGAHQAAQSLAGRAATDHPQALPRGARGAFCHEPDAPGVLQGATLRACVHGRYQASPLHRMRCAVRCAGRWLRRTQSESVWLCAQAADAHGSGAPHAAVPMPM